MARRKSANGSRSSSPVTITMEKHSTSVCCSICYEEYDNIEAGVSKMMLENCGHDFCQSCLASHCVVAIQEHRELPITCPLPTCKESISESQLQGILCSGCNDDSTSWLKYQRRLQMENDSSLVACTKCDALVSKQGDDNALTCPCGHSFCAIHGDAHPGLSCEQYESRPLSMEEQLSQTAVSDTTKACPHCNTRIELYGGCEHIVCTSCHNDWCYKCGHSQYLVGNTIRTCTHCRQSYMDHRKLEKQRIIACLKLPFTIPMALLYMIVATASALASGCCCLCFGCGVFVGDDEELRAPSPQRGVKMTLIYIVWPLLDILTDFGVPVYNGWLVKGIEAELGIASSTDTEESTVASQEEEEELMEISVLPV